MGYSATVLACFAQDTMITLLQAAAGDCGGSSNSWGDNDGEYHFFERGREQNDGAITGTVYKTFSAVSCRPAGSVRIEPDGTVTRWPTSTAGQRQLAKETADAKYGAIYERAKAH